jgi:hypothetical protein
MSKNGAAGVANLKFDSFGSFQDQFDTQAVTDNIECNIDIFFDSTTVYRTTFNWGGSETAGGTAVDVNPIVRRRYGISDTEAGGIANKTGTILDLDPTIAIGDNIIIQSKEIWVSSGGYV